MDSQIEPLPLTIVKQEENAPEVTIDSLKWPDSRDMVNNVMEDGILDSTHRELVETSEETAGHANTEVEDEASRLKALATGVRDQDELERDIGRQVG